MPNSSLFTQFSAQGLTLGKRSGDVDGAEFTLGKRKSEIFRSQSQLQHFLPMRPQFPYQYTGINNGCPVLPRAFLWVANLHLYSDGNRICLRPTAPSWPPMGSTAHDSQVTVTFAAFPKQVSMSWRHKQGLETAHLCIG